MEKKAQWSLVAAAWVLAVGVIGMGAYALWRFSTPAAAPPAEAGGLRSFGTADKPLDPIDGQAVEITPDTPKVNYNGNFYYFDDRKDVLGRSHKMLFLMDPLHYLTGAAPLVAPGLPTPGATLAPGAQALPPPQPSPLSGSAAPVPSPVFQ
jgi:YHS domain-containing protein